MKHFEKKKSIARREALRSNLVGSPGRTIGVFELSSNSRRRTRGKNVLLIHHFDHHFDPLLDPIAITKTPCPIRIGYLHVTPKN